MLVVDTSVWIDFFNGTSNREVETLKEALRTRTDIFVGDLIVCEVLQGCRFKKQVTHVRNVLTDLNNGPMVNMILATQAAQNYRSLREKGETIRSTIDLLIATYCCAHNATLLHRDRDFIIFEKHLGLLGAV
jgi:predicted nucleic acid-binding protein